jgi:two-component system, OmpR family, phosphate regulon sensor histidine kinase PhoR
VLWFDVPAAAAVVGVLAMAAAMLVPGRGRERMASAPGAARPGLALWPDTGMKLVVDAIADPCIITDADGIVRYQNRAATARLGPPRPGEPLSFKLRVPELLAAVERVGAGEAVEPVHFVERVPTERFSVAAVTAIRSRADRPRADLVLIRLGDETELMRMDRMRADFIANASHELRTPLASLTGFIETLLGPARDDAANRERFLRIMLDQAGRMARLIDDLLSLSRIEMRAHVRPSAPVDLTALVGQVADMLGPLAREHDVTLRVLPPEGPAVVKGDRDELIQVVANLVENAIKYGRAGGTVEMSLARDPVPAEGPTGVAGVSLAISDDGPGIAPEHLPRLTERFYRVNADNSRRQKGTGLGLAIVKHIVNRHRGRLAIRSELGAGSVITVWLESGGDGAGLDEESDYKS